MFLFVNVAPITAATIARYGHKVLETEAVAIPNVNTTPSEYDPYQCPLGARYKKIALDELREDENMRTQALAQFREWIAKHPRIKRCRTDASFLLRFLRTKKFSVPAACENLENYLTMRQSHPTWFQNLDCLDADIAEIINSGFVVPMIERDTHGRSILLQRAGKLDASRFNSVKMGKTHALIAELLMCDEENQVAGYTNINDESETTMAHISLWSFSDIKMMIKSIQNSSPMRQKETHFLFLPTYASKLVEFAMTVLSDKLRKRILFHKDLESFKEKYDVSVLPKEYGGTMPIQEMIDILKERLLKKRQEILALDEMYIDVIKNPSGGCDDGDIDSGVIGTFRKLEVD